MDLEFAIAAVDDDLHRRIAVWSAVRCLRESGLLDLTPFAPAVDALRRGDPPPPPFDDAGHCWTVFEEASPALTPVLSPLADEGTHAAQHWALMTIFHAAHPDSLVAALGNVVSLAFVSGRDGYREAFAELRRRFPEL